jgi:predicted nucleic acid-binding protein
VIAYLDTSALVKRYVTERRSEETIDLTAAPEVVATSMVSRAEVAAAFAKAVRGGLLSEQEARGAQRTFAGEWQDIGIEGGAPAFADSSPRLRPRIS